MIDPVSEIQLVFLNDIKKINIKQNLFFSSIRVLEVKHSTNFGWYLQKGFPLTHP